MNKFRERLAELGLMNSWPAWFDEFHSHLQTYKAEHGDCDVPHNYKCEDGYRLGYQVRCVRMSRKRGDTVRVTPEMIAELDALGFIWDASDRWGTNRKGEKDTTS